MAVQANSCILFKFMVCCTFRTISSFTAFGIKQEDLRFSELLYDPRQGRLAHATMSWQPSKDELGRHIACVQATDSTG